MQMLVNSDAILKVAEAVGLSSLPIAGIYAVWGRNELGLKYSELLKSVCPKYSTYVVVHFFAVLGCFWTSCIDALEVALSLLSIVLLGLPLQWQILCILVLYPKDRRTIAVYAWREKLHLFGEEPRKTTDFHDICSFAVHCLDIDGIYNEKTPDIFADGLFKYVEDHPEKAMYTAAQRLYEIQVIWDRLLLHHSSVEQEILVRQIFQHLTTKKAQNDSPVLGMICAGYVLRLHRSCVSENMSRRAAPVDVLIQVSNEVTLMQRNIFGQQENVIVLFCNTVILFLDWMYALRENPDLQNLPDNLRDLLLDLEQSKACPGTENVHNILKDIKEYMFASCSDALFERAYSHATRHGSIDG